MSKEYNPRSILGLPMDDNDAGADTIRIYLLKLLDKVWEFDEGFDGKRPFGNSGWRVDLYKALIQADAIDGEIDHHGYVDTCDDFKGDRLIHAAIRSLS